MYQAILKKDPNHVLAHYNLGQIAQVGGDNAAALAQYEKALATNTDYTPARRVPLALPVLRVRLVKPEPLELLAHRVRRVLLVRPEHKVPTEHRVRLALAVLRVRSGRRVRRARLVLPVLRVRSGRRVRRARLVLPVFRVRSGRRVRRARLELLERPESRARPDRKVSPDRPVAKASKESKVCRGPRVRRRILAAAGIAPRIVGTIADNATLFALVSVGQGITVVPARVLEDGPYNVTIAEQDLGVSRTIHAVTRKATTAAVSVLLDLLGST